MVAIVVRIGNGSILMKWLMIPMTRGGDEEIATRIGNTSCERWSEIVASGVCEGCGMKAEG